MPEETVTPIVAGEPTNLPTAPAVATTVKPDEAALADRLFGAFVDSVVDLTNTARATVEQYAASMVPLIARVSLAITSNDEATRIRAVAHLDHLRVQTIMQAGSAGIALQQRQEARLLAIAETLVNVGKYLR